MFNFDAAVQAAQEVVDRQEKRDTGNQDYKYPLLYPPKNNTITVRILFNPASGQIVRLVNRHEKVPCYRSYGIECPICKIMEQVKDLTGNNPFGRTKESKSRGVAFAQFIASTLPVDKGNNKGNFNPGELVLLMFPWSVYSQINATIQAISQTPTGMDQAFSRAGQGLFININVTDDFKYQVTQNPYLTYNPGNMSDDDFISMLEGMESLMDQVIPSQITEEVDKQVKEYTDSIYRQYIAPRTPTVGVPQGTTPVSAGQVIQQQQPVQQPVPTVNPAVNPVPQTVTSTPPQVPEVYNTSQVTATNSEPQCMGNHVNMSPTCMVCPSEAVCLSRSQSNPASGNP